MVSLFAKDAQAHERTFWWLHEGHRALRVGDWKIVSAKGQPWELYDLTRDRSESKDLAKGQRERVRAMAAIWTSMFEEFAAMAATAMPPQPKK